MKEAPTASSVTEEEVVNYLRRHPAFFEKRDDLLLSMRLPHARGEAISLVERQLDILRERNIDMRRRLSKLVTVAQDNEQLLQNTQRLIVAMLEATNLEQLQQTMHDCLQQDFKTELFALHFFGEPTSAAGKTRWVSLESAQQAIGGVFSQHGPFCGTLREQELQFVFGKHAPKAGSAAIAKIGNKTPQALLAVGSRDPNRYGADTGTMFLSFVADILQRLLPGLLHPGSKG